jgi:hypothetical protein
MWEKIKSGAVVALITVFIWFTADQNVSEEQKFEVRIRLAGGAADRYVAFAEPPYVKTFHVTLYGRRRHLAEFEILLSGRPELESVAEEVGAPPARRTLSGREILLGTKEFRQSPLRVRSVEPAAAEVVMDMLETVEHVRVECDYGDLKVIAQADPAEVSVTAPRFAAEGLRQQPVARAELGPLLRERPAGESFEVQAPLRFEALGRLDPAFRPTVRPAAEVTVTGHVAAVTERRKLGPIQVNYSIPPPVQEQYDVVGLNGGESRLDVEVTGPRDVVSQLKEKDIRALVEVLASDGERAGEEIEREVEFFLPGECTLAPGYRKPKLRFRLERHAPTVPVVPAG